MSRPIRLPARGERRIALEVLVAASITLVLLARIEGLDGLKLAGLGVLVAAGLLLVVKAPVGPVPLGYAVLIAVAGTASVRNYSFVAAFALLAAAPALVARQGRAEAGRRLVIWGGASLLAGGAVAMARLAVPGDSPMRTLLHVVVAGIAFLAVDFVAHWRAAPSHPISLRQA